MAGVNLTNHPLALKNYFYLDGDLYKILQLVKASDYLTAWNYHKNGMEEFILSDVKRRAEPGFRADAVGEMVNRTGITVRDVYQEGHIPRPKKTYPLGDGKFTPLLYSAVVWSKEDVYRLHDHLMEKHKIKERTEKSTGVSGRRDIPTRAELRAVLEHGTVYYVEDSDGKMVKVWKAEAL